ncbi:type III-A CRISPR-associated protein Cas10/Csm1 [Luteithermobacter gelatinilyticus]|uniref:type III-A CRISPR-associated protein Cas10/Csm1 n=1 Tax=Luteithermobacter gelatinilyticus TaxID=2582913 RepID=UPI001106C18C|nr:type III-A CRISPR-associated protein Cas10/Csm1 [Luteithermobacter gelatinilyticus]
MYGQTCRLALSALLHDLGKITQRARVYDRHERFDASKTLYCPYQDKGQYHSHIHAACTALSLDELEESLPDILKGDTSPFASRTAPGEDITDCLANAAAMHHRPGTFLQWCIAVADRIASGFEREEFDKYNQSRDREDYITAQLRTIFAIVGKEDVQKEDTKTKDDWFYPLRPLSPASIFPINIKKAERSREDAAKEYEQLWRGLLQDLKKIPPSHRRNWPLWLDHFDSLWLTYSHAVPSATAFNIRPDVSLYDHSKTTAALATALWRYHEETGQTTAEAVKEDWESKKFLLIQGDFFGIQDFIFNSETHTDSKIVKLLRGRSFFVSLLCECAALNVLDSLDLPPTSQIINAAGKFLIVAPNTTRTKNVLNTLQAEFDQWFLDHTLGLAGIGLATCSASPRDFTEKKFDSLKKSLFDALEKAKFQRFSLCAADAPAPLRQAEYPIGPCAYDSRLPAQEVEDGQKVSRLAQDQIRIGELLAKEKYSRLLIFNSSDKIWDSPGKLKTEIFGYTIVLTRNEDETGKFGRLAESGVLRRAFDISLPDPASGNVWDGYSRRNINAYVPLHKNDPTQDDRYDDLDKAEQGEIKTFEHLSRDDQNMDENGKISGISGLGVLKGDIDNLGRMFQENTNNFAKWASLSRQVNNFFALYLPWLCQKEPAFQNIYTVFAGGDDFYMIGPWYSLQRFAARMRDDFHRYVAENPYIHFSAGYGIYKAGTPLRLLTAGAEEQLEKAKKNKENREKDAFSIFDQTVPWQDWPRIRETTETVAELADTYNFSTAYLYDLIEFTHMAETINDHPENARWRSLFQYRTRRMVSNKEQSLNDLAQKIGDRIDETGGRYRIALFNHVYRNRK